MQKKNLKPAVIINSSTFNAGDTLFPALKKMISHKMIEEITLIDTQSNKHLFSNNTLSTKDTLSGQTIDEEYSFENHINYVTQEMSPDSFNAVWFRADVSPEADIELFFDNLNKSFGSVPIYNNLNAMLKFGNKATLFDLQKDLFDEDGHSYLPLTKNFGLGQGQDIINFASEYNFDVVIKAPYGFGGKNVFLYRQDGTGDFKNQEDIDKYIEKAGGLVTVQQFIYMERAYDDRLILMADAQTGKLEAKCAVRRVSKKGEWRSNVYLGGQSQAVDIDERHIFLAEKVGNILFQQGILLAAIDVMYDEMDLDTHNRPRLKIAEVNVRNVGGIVQASKLSGKDFVTEMVDGMVSTMFTSLHKTAKYNYDQKPEI
jgi:glutathione synthase/RimK-type ligase-like ATP-grasp enzyme